MPRVKSPKQVRYLLSKVSPLSKNEKQFLKSELESGSVTIKKKGKTKGIGGPNRPLLFRRTSCTIITLILMLGLKFI